MFLLKKKTFVLFTFLFLLLFNNVTVFANNEDDEEETEIVRETYWIEDKSGIFNEGSADFQEFPASDFVDRGNRAARIMGKKPSDYVAGDPFGPYDPAVLGGASVSVASQTKEDYEKAFRSRATHPSVKNEPGIENYFSAASNGGFNMYQDPSDPSKVLICEKQEGHFWNDAYNGYNKDTGRKTIGGQGCPLFSLCNAINALNGSLVTVADYLDFKGYGLNWNDSAQKWQRYGGEDKGEPVCAYNGNIDGRFCAKYGLNYNGFNCNYSFKDFYDYYTANSNNAVFQVYCVKNGQSDWGHMMAVVGKAPDGRLIFLGWGSSMKLVDDEVFRSQYRRISYVSRISK